VSQTENAPANPIKQLRKEMGFWDVLFFNIAPSWPTLGGRRLAQWHIFHQPLDTGCTLLFVPTALVINELSSRFPNEGGLYVWSKEAFGDFHGFVAGGPTGSTQFFIFPGYCWRAPR